jgi:hypothetical protein
MVRYHGLLEQPDGEYGVVTESKSQKPRGPDQPPEPSSNDADASPGDGELSEETSPENRADRVIALWNQSGEHLIACAAEMQENWKLFSPYPGSLRAYAKRLAARGFITEREAADPQGSAKFSSMRKIAEHREVLQDDETLARIGPRYTCMAVCARICGELEGGLDEKRTSLLKILRECPNEELDRHYLQDELAKLRRFKEQRSSENEDHGDDRAGDPNLPEKPQVDRSTKWGELQRQKARFDRVLITPRSADMRLIAKKLAHPDQIAKQLPLGSVLARDAVVIIPIKAAELSLVCEIAREQGLTRPAAVLLARKPSGPDIAREQVFAVFHRGRKTEIESNGEVVWSEDIDDLNPVQLAKRIIPGGKWLHVFADAPAEGQTTLVGDDGWLDAPEAQK